MRLRWGLGAQFPAPLDAAFAVRRCSVGRVRLRWGPSAPFPAPLAGRARPQPTARPFDALRA
ncbi:hypothetical protein C6Y14_15275 [Streptomyces dioscori]|uniref:Uncharacterized protein n=1 Tax=Streptomyces dioscori TaxID=2109333 RepID=A0A2P8Q8I8_9ACTN|nr:hypothetical protein C6Y14_15275 [Streptomyces dioscori]